MSDSVRDLLVRGIAAAKGNSKQEAKFYLEWVTRTGDATHDQLAEAYRWLAHVVADLNVSSANVIVDSYKLILVPMWVTYYRMEGKQYGVVINGCTGNLRAEKPRPGVVGWLTRLFGE